MKRISSILFIALLITGCEKVVELEYKNNQSKLVIEGNITNEAGPYVVKITRSIKLTETGTYPVVDDAEVTISDDAGNSEILTPQGGGRYVTSTLEGVAGRAYTLTVITDNQTYTAQSKMPQLVSFESIKVDEVSIGGEIDRSLIPVYTDPATPGNGYRFVLSINGKHINQHLVLNDKIRNGLVNTVKLEINDSDENIILDPGAEITITMQCVDENVLLFYSTLALMMDSGPGGGTTPNNPKNNISNGALGLFSAHTVETKTITIQ